MKRLLLLSNSTNHGQGFLDHAMPALLEFFGDVRRIVFVPFALRDRAAYTAKVADRLAREGIDVAGATPDQPGVGLLETAEAVFVGGGNTFRLLQTLQRRGMIEVIRRRVLDGMPYIGSSAGTNIAAPSIKTTNDMPIVQPESFAALNLVPFQINPHYLDADPTSTHMGETREDRLREFLEENDVPVLGLREGSWLRVEDEKVLLGGSRPARLFRRGSEPSELPPGDLQEPWGS